MGVWLVTKVYNSPYQTNSPLTFKFAIVRSRRGLKRKIIRMILTLFYNCMLQVKKRANYRAESFLVYQSL